MIKIETLLKIKTIKYSIYVAQILGSGEKQTKSNYLKMCIRPSHIT